MANLSDKIAAGGALQELAETSVDLNLTGQTGNLRVYANTTSAPLTVTLPAGEAGQIVEVIDSGENAGTNIITIAGTIDGATNTSIEADGGSREFTHSGTAWESSGGFEQFFERDAATSTIKAKNPDTLQSDILAAGDSGTAYSAGTANFTDAEANVDQDAAGWGNALLEGADLYSGTEGQASSTNTAANANDVVDGSDTSNVGYAGVMELEYDFGAGNSEIVQRVGIKRASFGYNNLCGLYGVEGSNDDVTWNTIVSDGALASNIPTDQSWTTGTYWDWDFSNSTSYRYYRYKFLGFGRWNGNSPGSNSGVAQFEAYTLTPATTTNTFVHRVTSVGANVDLSTLAPRDDGDNLLVDGEVLVEYSTDGGSSWSSQIGLAATQALGVVNSAGAFWLRYEMVGANKMKSSLVQSTATYTKASSSGIETYVNSVLSHKVTGSGTQIATGIVDSNGNEVIIPAEVSSAVNEITVTNAATTGAPKISASGDDANISLELAPKGTGGVGIGTSSPSSPLEVKPSSGSAANLGVKTGSTNGDSIRLEAGGTVNTWLEYRGYLGHKFIVNATELARLDSDGLKFNGDTAAANALDDYEEGAWTPTLTLGSGSVTYTTQLGAYTKVGRHVTCTGFIQLATVSTPSGTLSLSGLPFSSLAGENYRASGAIGFDSVTGLNLSEFLNELPPNTSSILIYKGNATSSSNTASDALQGTTTIRLSITYFAA